ncbi:MAG: CPCC family cysteine-rich protein [Bacteroidia bacterium]
MTERETFDTSKLTNEEKQILNEFYVRRELFDIFLKNNNVDLYSCPGCGYPTLSERGGYEICSVCNWEDDGQDESQANEIWGGPNQLTLTENRLIIGKTLADIAQGLSGEINKNPKEILEILRKHNIKMESFTEEKMMDASIDDPIWKEYAKASQEIFSSLVK